MMNNKIKTAVFPVAGLGSRFLPATKVTPKEMLPIVDKPLIQYAVEEAAEAGITKMIFVTGRNKRSIEDHFDTAYELEAELALKSKEDLLKIASSVVPNGCEFVCVRQSTALGLGHAVRCAKSAVFDEDFAVLLVDDLIKGPVGATAQLISARENSDRAVIGLEAIEPHQTEAYGVVAVKEKLDEHVIVSDLVEKPQSDAAPSNLGVVGRYILPNSIFDAIDSLGSGSGGEIQLTDALAILAKREGVLGVPLTGLRFDCGSKLGFAMANVAMGLEHPEIGIKFASYLRSIAP